MAVTSGEHLAKLRELIKDIDFGMLTTVDDGSLRSRPMSTNGEVDADGDLWFFTYASTHKVEEIRRDRHVNVSFADPKHHRYVSVSGLAELVRDRTKIEQLWKPELKAWFPKGADEPDIALLKVHATKAEYWDSPSSPVVHAIGFVTALATGQTYEPGESEKLDLESAGVTG
jgi:general stress protein 26